MIKIPKIYFSRIALELEFFQNTKLPEYLGGLFKGVFNRSFKSAMCITKLPECETCELKNECLYFNLFERELENQNINFLETVTKIPFPFVIHQTDTVKRDYGRGDRIEIKITILGDSVSLLSYLIYAFTVMGETGITKESIKFKVRDVYSLDFNRKRISVYNSKTGQTKHDLVAITNDDFADIRYADYFKAVLNFHTPVKFLTLSNMPKNTGNVGMELLLNSLLHRIYLISYLYCGEKDLNHLEYLSNNIDLDVVSSSLRTVSFDKKPTAKTDPPGMMGNLILRGNFDEYGKLLHIGSFINVGKNTMIGNGGYTVSFK